MKQTLLRFRALLTDLQARNHHHLATKLQQWHRTKPKRDKVSRFENTYPTKPIL